MEAYRAAEPLRIGDVTLVAIERTVLESAAGEAGCWLSARKEVFAIVVRDAHGARALGADSARIELDELIREMPELAAILA